MKKEALAIAIAVSAILCFFLGRITPNLSANLVPATIAQVDDSGHRSLPTSAVAMSASQQRLSGVRTEQVRQQSISRTLHTTGKVIVDGGKTYRMYAASEGWLHTLGNNPPGTVVHSGETLATFFSNELVKAQLAYFFSLQALERDKSGGRAADLRQAEESVRSHEEALLAMGMGEPQLHRLAKTREAVRDIEIVSPTDGVVLFRKLSPRQPLERETEIYRIIDLKKVRVLASILPGEMPVIRPGTKAGVIVRQTGKRLEAVVSSAIPLFSAENRVLQLRLEVQNPDLVLQSDMVVDVEFLLPAPPGVALPVQAVIDSGLHKIVYVQHQGGQLEPRIVELGERSGDRVLIRKGLSENELVVVDGNFLTDSESRMRRGSLSAAATSVD